MKLSNLAAVRKYAVMKTTLPGVIPVNLCFKLLLVMMFVLKLETGNRSMVCALETGNRSLVGALETGNRSMVCTLETGNRSMVCTSETKMGQWWVHWKLEIGQVCALETGYKSMVRSSAQLVNGVIHYYIHILCCFYRYVYLLYSKTKK